MIQDSEIMRAVTNILQRSEKQSDEQKVIQSFVDVGIIPQLNNANSQIFYGRRGTGKTHVLKVLEKEILKKNENVVIYIDGRTLGSTAQFSDPDLPMKFRCLALFRDILTPIYNCLLERIIYKPNKNSKKALESVDRLLDSILEPEKKYEENEVTRDTSSSISKDLFGSVTLSNEPSISAKKGVSKTEETETIVKYNVKSEDKVVFPNLHDSLLETLNLMEVNLYILIDEWSSIPRDAQPYLAEFLKRGVLPIPTSVLKIASLEYRSNFSITDKNTIIGFELGADISTAPDLDDYYVFDRNPDTLIDIYSLIIYKHLIAELPTDYILKNYKINDHEKLVSVLFTDTPTVHELARSSEGVIRDLINIFTLSFFHSNRKGRKNIDKKSIIESARNWFERDKSNHLDDEMNRALRKIITHVIGEKKARSFLVLRELEKHPMIQKLFDARVIHSLQRGYADKDNPGLRYNIYTLDYGTYVDLIGTSQQPQIELFQLENSSLTDAEIIVPFDDKRSIRRIILDKNILS